MIFSSNLKIRLELGALGRLYALESFKSGVVYTCAQLEGVLWATAHKLSVRGTM